MVIFNLSNETFPVCAWVSKLSSYKVTVEPLIKGPFCETPTMVLLVIATAFSTSVEPPAFLSPSEQAKNKEKRIEVSKNI